MRKSIIDALFTKTRQDVLSAFVLNPDKSWYLSDLAKNLKVTPSTIQKELSSLVDAGLLETRKDGNRVYYQTDKSCPVLSDLQALLMKTSGIADVVRSAFKSFKEIEFGFIYGSLARAEGLSRSDIDILIIGNVSLEDLISTVRKLEKELQREINPTIFSQKEFIKKLRSKDSFVSTVWKDKKIFVKGTESELQSLAQ